MAHLTAFLRDLSTCEGRIAGATALMDHVYGSYDPIKHIGANAWHPRTLSDNKSRYLWTDAFGVVNYISLAVETGKSHYLQQAAALIYAVHNTLGRERPGGRHCQWLGGASEAHPCAGGLRIGKIEPEGHSDGDGQYYHYLTK